MSEIHDLALIIVNEGFPTSLRAADLEESYELIAGERLVSVGYPLGGRRTMDGVADKMQNLLPGQSNEEITHVSVYNQVGNQMLNFSMSDFVGGASSAGIYQASSGTFVALAYGGGKWLHNWSTHTQGCGIPRDDIRDFLLRYGLFHTKRETGKLLPISVPTEQMSLESRRLGTINTGVFVFGPEEFRYGNEYVVELFLRTYYGSYLTPLPPITYEEIITSIPITVIPQEEFTDIFHKRINDRYDRSRLRDFGSMFQEVADIDNDSRLVTRKRITRRMLWECQVADHMNIFKRHEDVNVTDYYKDLPLSREHDDSLLRKLQSTTCIGPCCGV
ncbi:hypothetical protein EJ08DRAFT_696200 [Tothia fuscella]|uniref:Uncharacterized protein n=1 Tax=Tothia fuscella TaxID=1048955 RepID=A0A9P4TZJ5_9PEZI|nr:hypothetical protein EJ08DRAFT_696200 [Tothia fuscella]